MARTGKESSRSPGRGGDDDRRNDNNDRQGGNDGDNTTDRRKTSKRHTPPSAGTQTKRKKINTTAKSPKQNDGDVDNATRQGSATDENTAEGGISAENATDDIVEEVGVSAENNGNTTDDNVEGGEIYNNSVRIPGFSYLEKLVLQSITNTPPFFAVTRALDLKTITPYHKAVLKTRRTVLLKCISLKS